LNKAKLLSSGIGEPFYYMAGVSGVQTGQVEGFVCPGELVKAHAFCFSWLGALTIIEQGAYIPNWEKAFI
jgi:hypothetical protein